MSKDISDSGVLHVIVVGFHHKKGCVVEYAYPPLIPESSNIEVPSQWKHLPSLALPDGSHKFEADTVYFHLPDLKDPTVTVFGISCFRQIDAERLVNKTEDITRGSVQKSVCVISKFPLFGHIAVKMSLITEAYFNEGDFTRYDLIHATFANLSSCLKEELLHSSQLYVGLSARKFIRFFRSRSLLLFKLVLLERKVLFYQSPVRELSETILTLLSLHPGMLEKGLVHAACIVPEESHNKDLVLKYTNQEKENEEDLFFQNYGLPLRIFTHGNLCHPYLSLSFLDVLTQPSIHGYVIGATNVLFKQKKGFSDVIIDIEKDKIDIFDPELKKALSSTTEDLRFMDQVIKCVTDGSFDAYSDGVGWEGGDEWIRSQFKHYLICLLRTSLEEDSEITAHFNSSFLAAFKKTKNYERWISSVSFKEYEVPSGHPCAGNLSVTDMKLHFSNTLANTEGGRKMSQAVVNTGKAMAGSLSSARGVLSTWIGSFKQNSISENVE